MTDAATDTSTEAEQTTRGASAPAGAAPTAIERPGSLPTRAQQAAASKDKPLTAAAAVEMAHRALSEITDPLSIGAHAGSRSESERLVTHLFECNLSGYRGWRWAVTMSRPPRARTVTVCEMELLPGEDALLAPAWVPWADRLQPGDVSRSDRLPRRETDERLEPGWEATGEHDGDRAGEDGLLAAGTDAVDFGRARVLSPEGLQRAADRWYGNDHGPEAEGVRKAHAACATCGFLIPLSGPLRNVFGICANEWAADDGRVVSLDHGCGAHSETDLPDQGPDWPVTPSRLDEGAMEQIGTDGSSIRDGRPLADAQAEDEAGAHGGTSAQEEPERGTEDSGAPRAARSRRRGRTSSEEQAVPTTDEGDAAAADAAVQETTTDLDGPGATGAQDPAEDSGSTGPAAPETTDGSEDPGHADEPAGGADPAEHGEKRPARSRRASSRRPRRARSAGSAVEADAEEAAPHNAEAPRAETAHDDVQRHVAALDAVAELAASRGRTAGTETHEVPATLAELEAHLPTRG